MTENRPTIEQALEALTSVTQVFGNFQPTPLARDAYATLRSFITQDREPVARQWRSRIKGGAWDAWENGPFGQEVPPFMEIEVRYLYASPAPQSPKDGLPDIEAEGERLVAETHKQADGRYLWTDVVGAVQTAIAEERARHQSPNGETDADHRPLNEVLADIWAIPGLMENLSANRDQSPKEIEDAAHDPNAPIRSDLEKLITKYQDNGNHDIGAFDRDCPVCRILEDLRAMVSEDYDRYDQPRQSPKVEGEAFQIAWRSLNRIANQRQDIDAINAIQAIKNVTTSQPNPLTQGEVTLEKLIDALPYCDAEAQAIVNRIAGPRGKPNHCPDGVQVLDDAEVIIRAAYRAALSHQGK